MTVPILDWPATLPRVADKVAVTRSRSIPSRLPLLLYAVLGNEGPAFAVAVMGGYIGMITVVRERQMARARALRVRSTRSCCWALPPSLRSRREGAPAGVTRGLRDRSHDRATDGVRPPLPLAHESAASRGSL